MNALFVTQSDTIHLFYDLSKKLSKRLDIKRTGFFVADLWKYRDFLQKNPGFDESEYEMLKEWDIQWKAEKIIPDNTVLQQYEDEIGDPYILWSLVNDRRVFMGKYCKFRQSYKPRFSWYQMQQLLQTSILEIETLLERLKPDVIISYIPAVFTSYLLYLFAKARKIPYHCYKYTKIGNNIHLSKTIYQQSPDIIQTIKDKTFSEDNNAQAFVEAREIIAASREKKIMYEGIVLRKKKKLSFHAAVSFARTLRNEIRYKCSEARKDNQSPGVLIPWLFQNIVNPLRARCLDIRLRHKYLSIEDLSSQPFLFFPLHTEPELSLTLYGKPYQNQIEVIRNIALNMPISMLLIVKDHPRSLGFRDLSYYKKLLEIPNVRLIHPSVDSKTIIAMAQAVTVISGFVGFEGVMYGKPVLTFGDCPFNALPDTMVRQVRDPNKIAEELDTLLRKYLYDEQTLERFIAATILHSVAVNWYSVLMKRGGRYSALTDVKNVQNDRYEEELLLLAEYTIKRINGV